MAKKTAPQTLKGFRDFLPAQARLRRQVISVMEQTFQLYGFEPLETPALEYAQLLLGKYGQEADKLVYSFEDRGGRKIALKYDQTVPTARVIGQYQSELPMPFRRYQIQNAWRAENTQAGRFREFLQCDVDIFGSSSFLAEAEVLTVSAACLANLGLTNYSILINDREILFELMEKAGIEKKQHLPVIRIIDKLDKKTEVEVKQELSDLSLSNSQIKNLFESIKSCSPSSRLKEIIDAAVKLGLPENKIKFTPTLSRGLDYYTSIIFEIKIDGYTAGSVAGGGRYDKLIDDISGIDIPAVGLAFGFDRLIEAIAQLGVTTEKSESTQILITVFDEQLLSVSLETAKKLRQATISCEVYPDTSSKLDKQLKYADKKGIAYAVIIGPQETKENLVLLKNLVNGEQEKISIEDVIKKIK